MKYTPAANYNGSDSFTYTVSDGQDGAATGTVAITITAVNDAPVAVNDAYTLSKNQSFATTAPGVLANDSDIEGDLLRALVVSAPMQGKLSLNADGSFLYTPRLGYKGEDSFTYRISDGTVTGNTATVALFVIK